jgi:hypothetical protein
MNAFNQRSLALSCAAAALLCLPTAQAMNMTTAEHQAAKSRIAVDFKADKAACQSRSGNTKDVCVQEAKAKEKVSYADLESRYTGKPADQTHLLEVKAQTAYAVAKEKCDDQAGNAKDVCRQEAKAVETKALASAKLGEKIGDAKTEAVTDTRDADYKVAIEKCDALAGDAKSNCVSAARLKYGKS